MEERRTTIQALIADDHEVFRCGLRLLLQDMLGASIVREAESFDTALELLTEEGPGELVLVDLCMPGMSGAETLGALRDAFPDTKVVVVSASEGRGDIISALAAGVHGYVPKTMPVEEIAAALKSILEGRIFAPATLGRRDDVRDIPQIRGRDVAEITRRQRQVLRELLKGRSSKEIGRTLGITEGTVKIHLAAVYRALGVRSRAEAIAKLMSAAL